MNFHYKDVKKIMYRKICALILVLMSALPLWASDEYSDGDVIVVLKSSVPSSGQVKVSSFSAAASEFAEASGASVRKLYSSLSQYEGNVFMMIHSESEDAQELSSKLLQNPNVIAASPNYKVYAAVVPNDSYYGDCWGMEDIHAPSAWDITTGNSDVYVAVIDSGIDDTNPDLTANVVPGLGYRTIDSNSTSVRDDYGHGTHVAGTIAAVGNNELGVAGLGWNVKVIPLKALNSEGSGTLDTVISAVNHVSSLIDQGYNIRAVNLSLETYMKLEPTHDNLVKLPIWRAFKVLDNKNKAVIVVAAGNQSEEVGKPSTSAHGKMVKGAGYYVYPASFKGLDNMISVSALDHIPYIGTTFTATFSNTGGDIYAPGVDILSTWIQSSTSNVRSDGVSLRSAQGTSMAAPHVAGTAALVASVMPDTATAYQIKGAVLRGANLDTGAAVNYALNNFDSLPAVGTDGRAYDDYASYGESDYVDPNPDYNDNGKTSSSGGCEGFTLGLAGVIAVMVLARKRMSC